MKLHSNVKLLEIKLDRNHFTKYLAMIVEQFLVKERKAAISILWKVLISGSNNTGTLDTHIEGETTQSAQHRRKCHAWRNPDFLWT